MIHRHFMLHKPYGYVSQFICDNKKKKLLGELYNFPAATMAIGRLDEDSEGLILLTTDGKMSHYICSSQIEKEYYLQLDGVINDQAVEKLQQGIEIGIQNVKYFTKPCSVFKLETTPNFAQRSRKIRDDRHGPTSWISITIREGKFRQIRKMSAAVGFPTLRLIRVRIGTIHLNSLQIGQVRELDEVSIGMDNLFVNTLSL